MRLPYLQVPMEVIEQVAPELAIALPDWTEEGAGWGVVLLLKWGLGRCPDDAPPSHHDVVEGPNAAKLIARAMGYSGDPEALVTACGQLRPEPILERVEGGIRILDLERYDPAWGKNHAEEWKAIREARAKAGPESGRNRAGNGPEPGLQTQTQTQTQTHGRGRKQSQNPKLSTPPPPPAPSGDSGAAAPLAGPEEEVKHLETWPWETLDTRAGFWKFIRSRRVEKGLAPETPPVKWGTWFDETMAHVRRLGYEHPGGELARAYDFWLLDDDFAQGGWATPVFMSEGVWLVRIGARTKKKKPKFC